MALPERKAEDTGRKGYLEADEAWDETGRPRIYIPEPFWASVSDELEYEHAVEETRGMAPSARVEAIRLKLGISRDELAKPMPRANQTRRERDGELAKLRAQVDEGDAGVDWWHR